MCIGYGFMCSYILMKLVWFFYLNTHQTGNIRYHFSEIFVLWNFPFASHDSISTKIYTCSIFALLHSRDKERSDTHKKSTRFNENQEDKGDRRTNRFCNFAENYPFLMLISTNWCFCAITVSYSSSLYKFDKSLREKHKKLCFVSDLC